MNETEKNRAVEKFLEAAQSGRIKFTFQCYKDPDPNARLKALKRSIETIQKDAAAIRRAHPWNETDHRPLLERAIKRAQSAGYPTHEHSEGDLYSAANLIPEIDPKNKLILEHFARVIYTAAKHDIELIKRLDSELYDAYANDPPTNTMTAPAEGDLYAFNIADLPPILRRVTVLCARRTLERAWEVFPQLLRLIDRALNPQAVSIAAHYGKRVYQPIADVPNKTFENFWEIDGKEYKYTPKGFKPIVNTLVTLTYTRDDTTSGMLDKIPQLNRRDKAVYGAVSTYITEWGNEQFGSPQIYKVLYGVAPSPADSDILEQIDESLIKMSRIRIRVVFDAKECAKYPDLKPSYEDQLIDLAILNYPLMINGQQIKRAFRHKNEIPVLYALSKDHGQVYSVPLESRCIQKQIAGKEEGATRALKAGTRLNELETKLFIEERVFTMLNPNNGLKSDCIKFEEVYKVAIPNYEQKTAKELMRLKEAAREFCAAQLDSYVAGKNINIQGYKFLKEGRIYSSIRIVSDALKVKQEKQAKQAKSKRAKKNKGVK